MEDDLPGGEDTYVPRLVKPRIPRLIVVPATAKPAGSAMDVWTAAVEADVIGGSSDKAPLGSWEDGFFPEELWRAKARTVGFLEYGSCEAALCVAPLGIAESRKDGPFAARVSPDIVGVYEP